MKTFLRFLASGALLAFVLWKANLGQVIETFGDVRLPIFLLGATIHIPCLFLRAARWRTLLRALGCPEPLGRLTNVIMTGMFLNHFLPSGFGGDGYRAYVLRDGGRGLSGSLASIVVDRFLGVLALLVFVVAALFGGVAPSGRAGVIWGVTASITTGAVVAYLLLRDDRRAWLVSRLPLGRLREKAGRFLGALADFRDNSKALGFGMVVSLAVQALAIIQFYVFGLALGLPATLLDYALFIPLIMLLLMLPISIGGFGIREGLFVVFFATVGIDAASAVALAWLVFVTSLMLSVYGGFLMAISPGGRSRWLAPPMEERGALDT